MKLGELDSQLVDEFDLLGVNHFYNLFDVFFDDLFPDEENKVVRMSWAAGSVRIVRAGSLTLPEQLLPGRRWRRS